MDRRQFITAAAGALLLPSEFTPAAQDLPTPAATPPQHHGRPRPIVLGDGIELIDYRIYPSEDVPRIIGEISSTRDDMVDSPVVSITFPDLGKEGHAYAPPVLPVMRPGESNMIFGVLPKEIDSDEKLLAAKFGLCSTVESGDWTSRFAGSHFEITFDEVRYWHDSLNAWGWVVNSGDQGVQHVALQGFIRDPDARYTGVIGRGYAGHFSGGESKEFFLWGSTLHATVADPYLLLDAQDAYTLDVSMSLLDFYTAPGCRLDAIGFR